MRTKRRRKSEERTRNRHRQEQKRGDAGRLPLADRELQQLGAQQVDLVGGDRVPVAEQAVAQEQHGLESDERLVHLLDDALRSH